MAIPTQIEAWLDQAEADLGAARVEHDGLAECHRRYWLQQSYEKAIKAYALMRFRGDPADEAEFARLFLLQHSPVTAVTTPPAPLSKPLRLLAREVRTFLGGMDGSELLIKIDATTPRNDPAQVSYRYPFLAGGQYVAPVAYVEWEAYQGNWKGASRAVARLVAAVKNEWRVSARAPK